MLVVDTTDLIFAVDSIPAIFAVTQDPFIVYTSNVFAVLGLRSLYFLLAGIMGRFRYLCVGLAMVLCFVPFFAGILRLPFSILMPSIVFVCAIGAYAVNNRMIDIWYMILFGVVGMAFKKLDYPIAPMVLALVLGDMAENAMRQSLVMSQGSPLIFFNRPIAGIVNSLAVIFFFWPVIQMARERIFGRRKTAEKG